jgi:hypothetical protein
MRTISIAVMDFGIVFLIFLCSGKMQGKLRGLVSQNRRRFLKYGFDLDCTYITNRVPHMRPPIADFRLLRSCRNSTVRSQSMVINIELRVKQFVFAILFYPHSQQRSSF